MTNLQKSIDSPVTHRQDSKLISIFGLRFTRSVLKVSYITAVPASSVIGTQPSPRIAVGSCLVERPARLERERIRSLNVPL